MLCIRRSSRCFFVSSVRLLICFLLYIFEMENKEAQDCNVEGCSYSCSQSSQLNLSRHRRDKHCGIFVATGARGRPSEKEKKHACLEVGCLQAFSSIQGLRYHKKTVHSCAELSDQVGTVSSGLRYTIVTTVRM